MKVTISVDAAFPHDPPLHPEDREGILEDIEDIVRGYGGTGVIIGIAESKS